ncbi:MAG: hypothetical protein RL018_1815 [Pseudomonadota bacterium]|jgi:hypothetical protein
MSFGTSLTTRAWVALWLIGLVLSLMGCSSTQVGINGYSTRSYLGWIEVTESRVMPPPLLVAKDKGGESIVESPQIERVRGFGLRIGRGFSLGYFDDSQLMLPPDCHLVIVVKELAQLDQFFKTYPQLATQEYRPCVKALDF